MKTCPSNFIQLINCPVRDTSICLGGDGYYYMTGTTGCPDWWAVTGDIQLWKSPDLKQWSPVITEPRRRSVVWNIDRDGTWQKEIGLRDAAPFRPLWAPEIHYLKDTYWLTYCIPRLGSGILRSISGQAEGPYVDDRSEQGPLSPYIDASLFQDDDGLVYYLCDNGKLARMNESMTALEEELVLLKPSNAAHVGFEGTYLFKRQGRYYLSGADFVDGDYHGFMASSDHLYGPYEDRYIAVRHGGHNMYFQDQQQQWWSTFFGNNDSAPLRERPAILRVELDSQGRWGPII
ncbi:family 43 glycosylhydrolase [Paenibacillus taichungensis]|uniref:family 43 glycosylhydrolase n=1 Tax=Paenibacillus taichungensis TaxID=484184 RepID=UPI0039A64FDF